MNSLERYKATLEHINHVKVLEQSVRDLRIREAYLLSVIRAVQYEEQEMDCLTSHCRDLVNQAMDSSPTNELMQGMREALKLMNASNCTKCAIAVKHLEPFRGLL